MINPEYIIKRELEENGTQDELEYILPNTHLDDIFDLVAVSGQIEEKNDIERQILHDETFTSLPINVKQECLIDSNESLTNWNHETLQSKKGKLIHKGETAQEPKLNIYKCDQCSYVTNRKGTLNRHNLIHSRQKPYEDKKTDITEEHILNSADNLFKCDQCSYVTKRKGNLNNHKIHLPDKLLKCDQCPYVTKVKWNMNKHMPIHSPDKPFKCDQCSFVTKHKGSLNTHKLFHATDKAFKLFKCDQCSFMTKYKGNLNTHRLFHSWN